MPNNFNIKKINTLEPDWRLLMYNRRSGVSYAISIIDFAAQLQNQNLLAPAENINIPNVAWVAPFGMGGNDTTAELGNPSKPYQDPNTAMLALSNAGYTERERVVIFYPNQNYFIDALNLPGNYEANFCKLTAQTSPTVNINLNNGYLNIYGIGLVLDSESVSNSIVVGTSGPGKFYLDCEEVIGSGVGSGIEINATGGPLEVNINIRSNSSATQSLALSLIGDISGVINVPNGLISESRPLSIQDFLGDLDIHTTKIKSTDGDLIGAVTGLGGRIRIFGAELEYSSTTSGDLISVEDTFIELHNCNSYNPNPSATIGSFVICTGSTSVGFKLINTNITTGAAQGVQFAPSGPSIGNFYSDINTSVYCINDNGVTMAIGDDINGEMSGNWVNTSDTLPAFFNVSVSGAMPMQFGTVTFISEGAVANSMMSSVATTYEVISVVANNKISDINTVLPIGKEYTSASLTNQRF